MNAADLDEWWRKAIGEPQVFATDLGVHFTGRLSELLAEMPERWRVPFLKWVAAAAMSWARCVELGEEDWAWVEECADYDREDLAHFDPWARRGQRWSDLNPRPKPKPLPLKPAPFEDL